MTDKNTQAVEAAVERLMRLITDYRYLEVSRDLAAARQKISTALRDELTRPQEVDAKDAQRYRFAIALIDNAEALYAAVLNNSPNIAAINKEFDEEILASKPTAGEVKL